MNQLESSEYVKQINCQKHNVNLNQIDLTGRSPSGRICLVCIQEKYTSKEEFISLEKLFESKEDELLHNYPPLKNINIWEQIKIFCEQPIDKSQIDSFFYKLREDIETTIQDMEKMAKQSFIKYENQKYALLFELTKIGETQKLKDLLVSGSQNVSNFLQEKWQNAQNNKLFIQKVIKDLQEEDQFLILSKIDQKQEEIRNFIQNLGKFTLFEKKTFLSNTNFEKSIYEGSNYFTINKTISNSLQFSNNTQKQQGGQAFLNFVLDPRKRYTIRLNYSPQVENFSHFLFGLVPNELKNKQWGFDYKMSYYNLNGCYGLSKYIKRPKITSYSRISQKEEFEVRIFLSERILRVATLPNYESIIELDDANKINPNVQYRFFVHISQLGDQIEITDVIESSYEFEDELF